jgi:hypothetical protein
MQALILERSAHEPDGYPTPFITPAKETAMTFRESSPMDATPHRWYDQDPALARALDALKHANTGYHAQVALNIIGIIVEHYVYEEGGDAYETQRELMTLAQTRSATQPRERWYDVNASLRSAMQLLQDTPNEYQSRIIPHIASMIELTLERQWRASA